ncbi:unnamed protein product [Trichobilharzia regenti]|nr:unnamed protein product [Trichobilharzia regenti]
MPTGANRFNLSLGFRPLDSASSSVVNDDRHSDNRNNNNDGDADDRGGGDDGIAAFSADGDDDHIVNVDFNHHMIVRQHLEELLNTSKSIHVLATVSVCVCVNAFLSLFPFLTN